MRRKAAYRISSAANAFGAGWRRGTRPTVMPGRFAARSRRRWPAWSTRPSPGTGPASAFVFARAAWGQGLGTESALVVLEELKEQPALYRIWATCDVDNVGSARLLEKIGLIGEGRLHRWDRHNMSGEPRDRWSYAIWRLADETWS